MIDLNLLKNRLPINKLKLNQLYHSILFLLNDSKSNHDKALAILELFNNYISDFLLELEDPQPNKNGKKSTFKRIG